MPLTPSTAAITILYSILLPPIASAIPRGHVSMDWWTGPNTPILHDPQGCSDVSGKQTLQLAKASECTTFSGSGRKYFRISVGKSPVTASFPMLKIQLNEEAGCPGVGTVLTLFEPGNCNRAEKGNEVAINVQSVMYTWT